jgi:hypothetical protein
MISAPMAGVEGTIKGQLAGIIKGKLVARLGSKWGKNLIERAEEEQDLDIQ